MADAVAAGIVDEAVPQAEVLSRAIERATARIRASYAARDGSAEAARLSTRMFFLKNDIVERALLRSRPIAADSFQSRRSSEFID